MRQKGFPFKSVDNLSSAIVIKEIKFKILDIIEKNLATELESQSKQEYEFVEILNRQGPNSYSDDTTYKILLRKK